MEEINQLLEITRSLRDQYGRSFTLDGKLVGDIGEVLVAEKYNLELLVENSKLHDAEEINTGRKVQIKSSFKNKSYFPCGDVPAYFIGVQILEDGEIIELFNGPGQFIIKHYIEDRELKANGRYLYTLSGNILRNLNEQVPPNEKIG